MTDINRALLASARAIKRARGGRAFADMLRSGGAEAARALKQERGTPQQMLAALKGVKKEELEHSRVADLIKDQPLVTKDEIANIFDRNTPDVEEKKKKDPYEEKWTLPGGFNSRVLLLKLPEYEGFQDEKQHWKDDPNTAGVAVKTITVGGVTLVQKDIRGSDTKSFSISPPQKASTSTPSLPPTWVS